VGLIIFRRDEVGPAGGIIQGWGRKKKGGASKERGNNGKKAGKVRKLILFSM